MIQFIDVSKTYTNGVHAIKGINVKIIKMIYREEEASIGKILIDSQIINSIKQKKIPLLRRKIGVVFQDYKLIPTLTVYENVAFALEVVEESPSNIKRKVLDVLDLVKLQRKARYLPNELSGGEQQRV